jgi:putative ABC transport system permease protein
MGAMMSAFSGLGAVLFLLLMYILTKQVIEKNTKSIALTKILGFTNGEIGKLYLLITSLVVVASLILSIPLIDVALRWMFHSYMYTEMSGYIPYIIDNRCYVRMVVMGIVCYALVAIGMMIELGKIPKGEALKKQEL